MASVGKEQQQGRFFLKNPFKREKTAEEREAAAKRRMFVEARDRVVEGINGFGTWDDCLTFYTLAGLDDLYGGDQQRQTRRKVVEVFQHRYQKLTPDGKAEVSVFMREQMPPKRVVHMLDEYYVGQKWGEPIRWVDDLLTDILAIPDDDLRAEYMSELRTAGNIFQRVVGKIVQNSYERVHGKQDIYARFRQEEVGN